MRFYLLSDNIDTLTGMRLAGIEGKVIHEPDELKKHFLAAANDQRIAVILITERLNQLDSGYIKEHKINGKLPLVVEIPDRHGSSKPDDYILSYVKEAVGLKI